jgi:transcriptional regulator with XRE-family HTH domain
MTLPANNVSNASNVQEARTALGRRLRELRQYASTDDGVPLNLSGRKLAELLSWPPSKVSKLENAQQRPSEDDLRAWTQATNSERELESLLTSLRTLEIQHAEWQLQFRAGLRPHQHRIAERDAETRLFRVFEHSTIPGLLQTADYARARFAEGAVLFRTPNDIDLAVQTRMQRQELLYRRDKRFQFVLTEAALRYRRCSADVLLVQLDRLIALSTLPNVKVGVIDFRTRYVIGPWHGFWLRDDKRVTLETYSAELNLVQPQEIELYGRVFEGLASIASYGRPARAIITQVMDELATEVPEDSA